MQTRDAKVGGAGSKPGFGNECGSVEPNSQIHAMPTGLVMKKCDSLCGPFNKTVRYPE